jgi:hypothetical protein
MKGVEKEGRVDKFIPIIMEMGACRESASQAINGLYPSGSHNQKTAACKLLQMQSTTKWTARSKCQKTPGMVMPPNPAQHLSKCCINRAMLTWVQEILSTP